ncbi:hypothetical protein DCAR_0207290 [Daucus carota subsp. sativus]|uniref:Uncharacterized protein n=2 Tax=Daucus carota subsp. sativus TaxID=79200 RepID=A0A166DSR3_DAUCS|nr:hypothetical protein DCAR_0207290 [Daucus carota subsp. sativus]
MGEPGGLGSVSRVLDSGESGFEGNSGFGADEIMVEIVGSDVIVDGDGGNEMSWGDGGVFGFEGNVGGADFVDEGVGVEDYGVTEDVVFLENVGVERRDAVMASGNENRLGGREEVRGNGGKGCEMMTLSEALSCGSEISGGNFVVAAGLSSGETEVIREKRDCGLSGDKMVESCDGLALQMGFMNKDASSNASTGYGFRSNSDMEISMEVKDRGLNGRDQVAHDIAFDAESTCLETVQSTSVETDTGATCVNSKYGDHQTEAVARMNEMLSEKNKAPQSNINSPEDFEFDNTYDSYWTDIIVLNYDKDQILYRGQNGEAENPLMANEADEEQMCDAAQYGEARSQLVPSEADKPVKSGRKFWKPFSRGKQVMVSDKPVEDHADVRSPDCTPTELILKFSEGKFVPSEIDLNKIFRRFGPLMEHETEIDMENSCAKVVYKRCSDAKVALSSAGLFNIFGPMLVSFELSSVPSASFKTLPAATVYDREDAS